MRFLKVLCAALCLSSPALAQTGTVTNHAFAIGRGPGVTGYTSLLCTSAQLAVGQAAADPICQTITGDVTISAGGVTAIGANKVQDTMLRQSGALALIGRSANSTGNVADIAAIAGSGCAFRESGNTVGCGTLATAAYAANSVTNAKLAQMTNATTKCRTTAGTGDPEDCTATQMRSLLSLVIGTNVEAWDTDLDALAALASNGLIARTGSGAVAARTLTAPAAGITVTNGDGVAGNPTLVLANDLAALEGLSTTGIARRTGTDAWSLGTLVSNSELATAVANTLKGNATGSTAAVTDIPIPSCSGANQAINWTSGTGPGCATIAGSGGGGSVNSFPGGRLTLTSGVAITTADVTAAAIVYYAPATGIYVPIYNGSTVSGSQFTATSTDAVGLSTTLGSNWTTNTNYDWFVGLNSSTVTMCSGPAWTSDSARGTGAGTTELQIFNGLWTNKNSMTCRYGNATTFTCAANQCTYVGSMRTVAAGQAEDSLVKRFIWNAYNQSQREMRRVDATGSWNYSTAVYRQTNGSASNQIEFLLGLSGGQVEAELTQTVSSSTGTARPSNIAVALDSTTATTDGQIYMTPTNTLFITGTHRYRGLPAIGYHKLVSLELGAGADTQTWYGGDNYRLYGNIWN